MISYILRRALYMIPVLLGINAITLVLFFQVAPDPVLQYAGRNPSQETIQAKRIEFELDAPIFPSGDYLSGEDILKARRADRVSEIIDRLHSDLVLQSSAEQYQRIDFMFDWRDAKPEADEATSINARLATFNVPDDVRVDFSDIELTPSEKQQVESRRWYNSQFFRIIRFNFANSMTYQDRDIWDLFRDRLPVTLKVTLPMLFVGLAVELILALFAARHRGRMTDTTITIVAVLAMSIPFLSYIVFAQWLAAETRLFPVSGYADGFKGVHFLVFPVLIGVIAGLGGGVRFYRAVLLEEMDREYVRTARAKGVKENDILFIHVLRNGGIPIVTRLTIIIPFLITGSLLIERMFELPGLGDLMLSAIRENDFWVVMPLTYIMAVVYSIAVLLTDVLYAIVDPRVRVSS